MFLPTVIQGGMGAYISNPYLANKCSRFSKVLGTVSGVAAEIIMTRVLQRGDVGENFRRALANFPFPKISEKIIRKYFVKGGIPYDQKFRSVPVVNLNPSRDLIELIIAANFTFVWLAKEGHPNPVSINYLEKMQIPHIYSITGAMLAGVDFITMGAGITMQIPAILDALSIGNNPSYRVTVEDCPEGTKTIVFSPKEFFGEKIPEMKRPNFLPIISTDVLAKIMANNLPSGSIQGFVLEKPIAGGHNAPPRKKGVFDNLGQPVYGSKDEISFTKLHEIGIPFWLGGGCASPDSIILAKSFGAEGIQVGSIFALSEDSGMEASFRKEIRRQGYIGTLVVRTDPQVSPTGFPFKVIQLNNTQSDQNAFNMRERVCDVCLLRIPYLQNDGQIGYRCSAEPTLKYHSKGGKADSKQARCLCNGLLSACGYGNIGEIPILTLGDDFSFLRHLMKDENSSYTTDEVVRYLLS